MARIIYYLHKVAAVVAAVATFTLLLMLLLLLKPEQALVFCWLGWGGAVVATATATLLPKLRF